MKKFWITAISLMMAASLAACSGTPEAGSSASETSSAVSSSGVSPVSESSDADADPDSQQRILDFPRYTGVVDDFAVNDAGQTVLVMKPALDADGSELFHIALGNDTKYGMDPSAIANGSELEILYTTNEQGETTAIAVNDLNDVSTQENAGSELPEAVSYDGKVVSVQLDSENPGEGWVEMTDLEGGNPYVFHFNAETAIDIDLNAVQPGDQLHVEHSPISTRSLPPQSNAFSISDYAALESPTYDGKVASVTMDADKPGQGSVEMTDFEGGNRFIFHFSQETTKLNLDMSAVQPGDQLHVVYGPMMTMSIPPQSPAVEISPYAG